MYITVYGREGMVTGGNGIDLAFPTKSPMTKPLLFTCLGKLTNNLRLMVTLTFCRPCTSPFLLFCLQWTVISKRKKREAVRWQAHKMKERKYLYDCPQLSPQRLRANIPPHCPEHVLHDHFQNYHEFLWSCHQGQEGKIHTCRHQLVSLTRRCNIKCADFVSCIGWKIHHGLARLDGEMIDVSSLHANLALFNH